MNVMECKRNWAPMTGGSAGIRGEFCFQLAVAG